MEKKKLKRLLSVLVIMFVGISFTSASYLFGFSTSLTGEVIGGSEGLITIQSDFSDFVLNVSESSQEDGQTLEFYNDNGQTNMSVDLSVNKTLLDLSCPNYENDCDVGFYQWGNEISDGDNLTIYPGTNHLTLNTTCIKRACEQSIEVDITLTE